MRLLDYLMEIFDRIEPYIYKLDLLLERKKKGKGGVKFGGGEALEKYRIEDL